MDEVLIGYFKDQKYGEIAHYLDKNSKSIFYVVHKMHGHTVLDELNSHDTEELLKKMGGEGNEYKS